MGSLKSTQLGGIKQINRQHKLHILRKGKKSTTTWGQIKITVLVFLSASCFPIYPTTSIMTVLLQRSRSWNVVWSGHDFDQMFGTSILDWNPDPECCGRESRALCSRTASVISKHRLGNLWETWRLISPHQTPAIVVGLRLQTQTAGLLLGNVPWHSRSRSEESCLIITGDYLWAHE